MNFLEAIEMPGIKWTHSFIEMLYDANKDWNHSPAGAFGWKLPLSDDYREIVAYNWQVQHQLLQLHNSLTLFQRMGRPDDWLEVEKDIDGIRRLVAKMRDYSDLHLDSYLHRLQTEQGERVNQGMMMVHE
jgi:hypothetical protein